MINLDVMAKEINELASSKGFWDNWSGDFTTVAYKLAMIHSEVTEVLEAVRKSQGTDKVTEELADIIIRVLDLYAGLTDKGLATGSLNDNLKEKHETNKSRPRKHGVLG